MNIHIRLYIKFRAFFRDLYKLDKQWEIAVGPLGLDVREEPVNVPTDAKVVYNNRGVKLNLW